jgi:TRAP-type C4-dicarboxylate transport system substrate-binding protein
MGAVPDLSPTQPYARVVRMSRTRVVLVVVAAVAVGLAASRLGGGPSNRAGGANRSKAVVLTLASHETGADVRDWAEAVRRLSHGSLRIVVKGNWRRREVDYEKGTIADVRSGRVDLASIPVRAYDSIGVRSFQGLLAPFLIDSYALQERVLASRLPTQMLAGAHRLGVVGVALLPGPLQRVLSIGDPTLAPPDYYLQEVGIHRSDVAASTFRALGTLATELAGGEVTPDVRGIETGLVELVANRYNRITADETLPANVTFWPRAGSVVMNDKAFAALTPKQRQALEGSAGAALAPATKRLEHDERGALAVICRSANRRGALAFLTATPSDLAALRRAVTPVYDKVEREDTTREVIAAVEAMKQHATPTRAPGCRGRRLSHTRLAAGALRMSGELKARSHTTWQGHVTSKALGQGLLILRSKLPFRIRKDGARAGFHFESRFSGGTLRGCINARIAPAPGGGYDWIGGPGAVKTASPAVRRYTGLSLRFTGVMRAGDLRHVRVAFASDLPNGLARRRSTTPC